MGRDTAQLCQGDAPYPCFFPADGTGGVRAASPQSLCLRLSGALGSPSRLLWFSSSTRCPPDVWDETRAAVTLPWHTGAPSSSPSSPSASQCPAGGSPTLSTAQFSSQKEGEIPPKAKYVLKFSFCGYLGMIQVCGSSPESHGKQGSLCFRCSSCST